MRRTITNRLLQSVWKIQQSEGNSQFSTWSRRIAINEALMTLRKRGAGEVAILADRDGATRDSWTKEELRDVQPDPERQCLVKDFASRLSTRCRTRSSTLSSCKKKRAGRTGNWRRLWT